MSNKLDVNRLIAEVKQRPALWDVRLAEYKDRAASALLWREIAENVGCDVEQCKRKWKNIRDAYRAEVRRTERRVQRLKLEGHEDPKVSDSKWVFFKPMSFMSESKRKRYSTPLAMTPHELSSDSHEATYAADAASADAADAADAAEMEMEMEDYCKIKMEHTTTDEEGGGGGGAGSGGDLSGSSSRLRRRRQQQLQQQQQLKSEEENNSTAAIAAADAVHGSSVIVATTTDDDDEANDKLFQEFQSVATPQAARRLSGTLSLGGSLSIDASPPPTPLSLSGIAAATPTPTGYHSNAVATFSNCGSAAATNTQPTTAAAAATATAAKPNANCKCPQREDQVHFLEDLEREEQQLMQSTRRDITRASGMSFFGDSDYNFLVSFLPQMKRLSELQNLQFRAKMSELMLHIMAQQQQQQHHHQQHQHHQHQHQHQHPIPPTTTLTSTTTTSLPSFGCIVAAPASESAANNSVDSGQQRQQHVASTYQQQQQAQKTAAIPLPPIPTPTIEQQQNQQQN